MEIRFADDDRAGGSEPPRHLGVFGRDAIVEHRARGGRSQARGVDVVLQRDRNAVERPPQSAGALFGVEHPGLGQSRFTCDGNEGVDLGVVHVDAREAGLHEVGRRDRAGLQPCRDLGQRQPGKRIRSGPGRRRRRLRRRRSCLRGGWCSDCDARRRSRCPENGDRELASGKRHKPPQYRVNWIIW